MVKQITVHFSSGALTFTAGMDNVKTLYTEKDNPRCTIVYENGSKRIFVGLPFEYLFQGV